MTAAPWLSIVVATHGKAALTRAFLESLLAAAPSDVELVLVDNGSPDETPALLTEFARRRPFTRAVLLPDNTGYARANNLGASLASAPALLFLNNDMLATPGCLEPYRRLATDGVGAIGVRLIFEDRRVQHAGLELRQFGVPAGRHYGMHLGAAPGEGLVEVPAVTGACLGIGKQLFGSLGGFSEDYELLYQDVDLCFRVIARGRRVEYDQAGTLFHLESATARGVKTPRMVAADWDRLVGGWPRLFGGLQDDFALRVAEAAADRQVVVYGTGRFAFLLERSLSLGGIPIAAFTDSNEASWGTSFCGRPVVSPAGIGRMRNPLVLVATTWEHDVRARLASEGLGETVWAGTARVERVRELLCPAAT